MTNTTKQLALLIAIVLAVFFGLGVASLANSTSADEVVALDVSDPALEELRVALIESGFSGESGDGTDDVIFVPVWAVVDVPGGTWTVTDEGPKRCVDWATTGVECTDGVYLPWHPDFHVA